MEYEEYLIFAKQLALEAGDIMLKYFRQKGNSHYKKDKTIVTKADIEINELVIKNVKEKYPKHGVYGEEDSVDIDKKNLWLCDPIDGTSMFSWGVPVAVFSLALVVDGVPVIGVIYDPFTKSLYEATKGHGAKCNNEKISVNKFTLKDKESAVGYNYSPNKSHFNTLATVYSLAEACRVRGTGSYAHDAILVADGSFVGSIVSGRHPYDIAAAVIIAEEAGGKVTNLYGENQLYNQPIKGAIFSNGIIHDELVSATKDNMRDI